MKNSNQLALIVSYYLSRCDKDAYSSLGHRSFNEAAKEIGNTLGVKVNTIKNMRDEFDPHHENPRVGWLKEPRGSRLKVLRAFQEMDDSTLLEIVKGILFDKDFKDSNEYQDIQDLFKDKKNIPKSDSVFILRAPTGKKAEEFFVGLYQKEQKPIAGELIDRRDQGCGYDFEVVTPQGSVFIEVKGLASDDGGILFTNKEWQTALKHQNKYFLVLVRNVMGAPQPVFIQNPGVKLKSRKNIYTTVQLSWGISKKELRPFTT